MRFLDNFSAGTRGAASAEHFLRTGKYAVIFLHRQHSLQPFSRHYSHSTNPFLNLLEIDGEPPVESKRPSQQPPRGTGRLFPPLPVVDAELPSRPPSPRGTSGRLSRDALRVYVPPPHLEPMVALLRAYKLVRQQGLLLSIPFVTVADYLFLLRGIARVLGTATDIKGNPVSRSAMYYLAAAVSDFFIPRQKMVGARLESCQLRGGSWLRRALNLHSLSTRSSRARARL